MSEAEFALGVRSMPTGINPLQPDTPLRSCYTVQAFAYELEISESSLRSYISSNKIPGPDGYVGNVPLWHELTVFKVFLQRSEDRRHNPEKYKQYSKRLREQTEAGEQALAEQNKRIRTSPNKFEHLEREDVMELLTLDQELGRESDEDMVRLAQERGYIT